MIQNIPYRALFSPGHIGSLNLPNRIVMAPMVTQLAGESGAVTQRQIDYYARRAQGGVGLIIVEATCIAATGRTFACHLSMERDAMVSGHAELTEAVHREGAKIALQIHHGGNRASPDLTGGVLLAPSDVPEPGSSHVPRPLVREEIDILIEAYAQAAHRAVRAGYDAVEIHGAHGYLIHQFLSPATNRRTDEFGGSLENRTRFACRVVEAVRQAVGSRFPILFRMSAEGGYGVEEAAFYARLVTKAGADAIHVSAGGTAPITSLPPHISPMAYPEGWLVGHAATIKASVAVPVIAVWQIRRAVFANAIISQGQADFVALGRPLVADPFWPAKVRESREEDIIPCLSCDHCRVGIRSGTPIRCLVNPEAGREALFRTFVPAARRRCIVVVGGGPAGLQAASVAAQRGHRVTLFEEYAELGGGQLHLAALPPYKESLRLLRDYLVRQVYKAGVTVRTGQAVDASLVEAESPDTVILATGAQPLQQSIPGSGVEVVLAEDVLLQRVSPHHQQVVVLGGRQVGCETAEFLALRGNRVTVAARSPESELAKESAYTYREALLGRLKALGVTFLTGHDAQELRHGQIILVDSEGKLRPVPADLVVLARGYVSRNGLADELRRRGLTVYTIGDCVEPRTIAEAMYEGSVVGNRV